MNRPPATATTSEHAVGPPPSSSPPTKPRSPSESDPTLPHAHADEDFPGGATNLTEGPGLSKEVWWAERRGLDARLGQAVRELEKDLGWARFFIVGELPRPLRRRLRPLGARIAARVAELRDDPPGDSSGRPGGGLFAQKCFVVLQSLPLMAAGDSNAGASPSTALYDPRHIADSYLASPGPRCAACTGFLRRTSAALFDVLARLWMNDDVAVEAAVEWVSWLSAHPERLQAVCLDFAQEVLGLMYDYLVGYYGGEGAGALEVVGEVDGKSHRNLLALPREHLYLVLENEFHDLPLEGMDVLRGQSCSRVPSVDYLRQFELRGGTALPENSFSVEAAHFYIDSTAVARLDKFERLLHAHPRWTVDYGPLPPPPDPSDDPHEGGEGESAFPVLQTLLHKKRSVYVYLGHKRGELELPRRELYDRFPFSHFPDVLLMGCSSAWMMGNAFFENYGMPWAYLHAGARTFIGCLWDITNGEVDRLSRRFLRYSTTPKLEGVGDGLSVGEALSAARKVCKLPFLSGMATVMYGVNRLFALVDET
ncbi:unnamed protein product [Phytomonas sp. Hart1]|nr:unnamed protein product [Phytomonas sp. Hart1]|eukprot:CCW66365.1 unnamed protein product [Phytomonas sp. isolate Hart1]